MKKPKQALIDDGFLPESARNQRGRLSLAAKVRLAELVAEGVQIEGYSAEPSNPAEAKTSKAVRTPAQSNLIIEPIPQTRFESELTAKGDNGAVGMRTVCNICRNSLTHCPCAIPKVWADFDRETNVTFIRKA